MNRMAGWKTKDAWSWREFVLLLLLEFVFVMAVVKYGAQRLYLSWLGNPLYSGMLTGLTIAIVLLAGLNYIALRPQRLTWAEIGLRRFPAKDWGRILIWILVLVVLSTGAMLLTNLFGNTVSNSKTESLQQNVTWFTVLLAVISAGVISPLYEELFYRGFMYRWLQARAGVGWGIMISSLIFTAAHYPTMNAMPVNFIAGVVLAWAYEKTGSVVPAMIIHGVTNTIAVLLTATG
ncbi:type II CAAX endopeptidase family protein [Paenibacillus sp. FSL W8-0186]|uniref:CAAX amino protease n=1 Tax=Paenibacillus woosongensis TaxID=307580 RepID=A0ABQ4MRD7_9BACL|nr:type II CAAX endopeptidase family protein [Paenibacillus woosongensis]GIP58558.1 CAAX amino protease [Paenibacillus woosongensis]